jgi:hypothetical protein
VSDLKVFAERDSERPLTTYWLARSLEDARGYHAKVTEVPPETPVTVGYGGLDVVPIQLRFRAVPQEVPLFPYGITLQACQWAEIRGKQGFLAFCWDT